MIRGLCAEYCITLDDVKVIRTVAWLYNVLEFSMNWIFMWSLRSASWSAAIESVHKYLRVHTLVYIQLSSPRYWCVSKRQIHEELFFPLFADIRALTASLDSKLADVGNPSSTANRQILTLNERLPRRLTRKPRAAGHHPRRPIRLNESLRR